MLATNGCRFHLMKQSHKCLFVDTDKLIFAINYGKLFI